MRHLFPLLCASLLIGCARYEYVIVQPTEFAGPVGTKTDHTFTRDPLEYRLRTVDNRLVMRIYNQTEEPIVLIGSRSTVVDPQGQSHPLITQAIAPHAHVKLIFPPPRPRIEPVGPTIGFGFGVYGRAGPSDYDDPVYNDWGEPRYFVVYDDDTLFWEWRGEGEIRVTLLFERNKETFTHDFVIRRMKV